MSKFLSDAINKVNYEIRYLIRKMLQKPLPQLDQTLGESWAAE